MTYKAREIDRNQFIGSRRQNHKSHHEWRRPAKHGESLLFNLQLRCFEKFSFREIVVSFGV